MMRADEIESVEPFPLSVSNRTIEKARGLMPAASKPSLTRSRLAGYRARPSVRAHLHAHREMEGDEVG